MSFTLRIHPDIKHKFAKPEAVQYVIKPPELFKGVVPDDKTPAIAMDSDIYDYANTAFPGGGFPGYPYLSELMRIAEYRSPAETIATEMTRKWIKISTHGEKSNKIDELQAHIIKHNLRMKFREIAFHDCLYGRSQLYVKIKGQEKKLDRPLLVSDKSIKKDSLACFVNVEPMWTTPDVYNASRPLDEDFYKPVFWWVFGERVHKDRLFTFIGREMPDMLKPVYNFGGISLSQLLEPFVNAWLRNRDSVRDIIHSFSTSGIKTNMGAVLTGDAGDSFYDRLELYNAARDNRGILAIDKDTEEFFQFNVPLSSLADLLQQCKEQMNIPTHLPSIKAFGEAPNGLGATGDGEIKVWYDFVHAFQENLFRPHLDNCIKILMLDLWGYIDESITFDFEPLDEPNPKEVFEIKKTKADTAAVYINNGVISPDEERQALIDDKDSGYNLNGNAPEADDEENENA